ncbi:MAG TPA: hypothetical protein VF491_21225 [Vicinamibacterales bacterium]
MTFRVDGTSHSAASVTASFANGILSVGGTDTSRNTSLSFAVTPSAGGVGTYTFGPLSAANALILVGSPAQSWQGGVGTGSGTITITTLTSTTATGTFSFSLVPVAGSGATGTKAITEGAFNVTLTTAAPPPATPSGGSTFSVLIDGVQWTSSLSCRATMTNNILTITGQDTNFRVITLAVPTSAGLMVPPSPPATISLNFGPDIHGTVTMVLGAQNWDNGHAGGEGTFTITSISQTRVTGTFTVTLVNNPINTVAVPTARLTSGTFDMALERF